MILAACAASSPRPLPDPPRGYVPADATVELHSHLFMKEGMGGAFHGDFFGPLQARSWRALFDSQVDGEALEASGIGLLVASVYAHPVLGFPRKESIRRQLDLIDAFVAQHPNWVIARDAAQARTALGRGQRVIVLALEHAYGVLDFDADLDEFIGRRGIRIVTFLHIANDLNGSAALLPGRAAMLNPWRLLFERPPLGSAITGGLTARGRAVAKNLIQRGVWIDVAHASDPSARELIALEEAAGLPVLFTHTALRTDLRAERGIADWELAAVVRTGGVVGLMPSAEMLAGTPGIGGVTCPGPDGNGLYALAEQVAELVQRDGVPAEDVALGSDYNGGVPHLPPPCVPLGLGSLDRDGLWNIGQVDQVWRGLAELGAPIAPRATILQHFLEAWGRVAPREREPD